MAVSTLPAPPDRTLIAKVELTLTDSNGATTSYKWQAADAAMLNRVLDRFGVEGRGDAAYVSGVIQELVARGA